MPTELLTLDRLTKIFPSEPHPVTAVDNVSFSISGDEFFTMLGPSGCGKTTTLRMIAGLETITSGHITLDGRDVTGLTAYQRGIGMVFQSYALFPHMSVHDNAAYGLRVRGMPTAEIEGRVQRMLDTLGLGNLAKRYPADLSGGQQQRVSIARALVYDPRLLLLDEPLANLDAKLRVQMREEIRRVQKELGVMTIYVTHDQEEALSVSDRIGVFNLGRLMQVGTPREIYSNPQSLFVADFIGKANFLRVDRTVATSGAWSAAIPGLDETVVARAFPADEPELTEIGAGGAGALMVRPEHLVLSPAGAGIPCRVKRMQFLGSFVRYTVACDAAPRDVLVDLRRPPDGLEEGTGARLSFAADDAVLYARSLA